MGQKVNPIQTTFNGGIQSPLLNGFMNAPRRDSMYKDSQNLLVLKQGPAVRRGGTRNVYEAVTATSKVLSFEFNDEQAYILDLSSLFMRVLKHEGVVTVSGADETIVSVTATSPPRLSTSTPHSYVVGNWVNIVGLSEAVELNDRWMRVGALPSPTAIDLFEDLVTPLPAPAVAETSSTGTISVSFFLAIPYDDDDLFDDDGLFIPDVVQSNDVMFIAHPDFQVRILARTADDAWTITKMTFNNGPYIKENQTEITMTLSARVGRVFTVTSSVADVVLTSDTTGTGGTATEANRLFTLNADDDDVEEFDGVVGEAANIAKRNKWMWGEITEYINTTSFKITISTESTLYTGATNGNPKQWRLGAYSDTTGYPSVIDIHEARLVVGANSTEPRRVDFSVIDGFNSTSSTWDPHSFTKIVRSDDGFSTAIGGGNAAPIQWIKSMDRGLVVGTNNTEGVIRSASTSESLSPTNKSYKAGTTIGSRSIQPLFINGALLFVQFAGRRLHELSYSLDKDRNVAPDMTELAEHLTREGIIDITYQQQPIDTVWCVLGDGSLLGFTYERDSDVIGWHRHVLGGTDVVIQSVAVIPVSSENRDELWMNVTRTINGKSKNYIERMERWYEDDIVREDIFHMDSGISYVSTKFTITAATSADPVEITVDTTHFLTTGDNVYIRDVVGMTEINDRTFSIVVTASDKFELQDLLTNDIDGTGFGTFVSGGTAQESIAKFRALDYIEGETVQVYVDGNTHEDLIVTDGAITLSNDLTGANVSVGLGNKWTFEPLLWEAGSENGTAMGKIQKINKMVLRLLDTLGLSYGQDSTDLKTEAFTNATTINDQTQLFTGDLVINWPGGSQRGSTAYFEGDGPFPIQIQAVIPEIETEDPRS